MNPAAFAVLNLDALQHNLAVVRQHAPNAKIMAVIKGNGYGHGLLRVAEALTNVDAFAVARVDEGLRLRKAGINNKIVVLEGFTSEQELNALLAYRLDVLIHSFTQLDILSKRHERKQIGAWLKIDTGMNRLGFKPTDFPAAYQQLKQSAIIKKPIRFMTHLANADDMNDKMTTQQITLFKDTLTNIPGERSIANSAGILGWSEALTDWVRPGVMLYGISPFPGHTGSEHGLKPIMEFHSRLIAVKSVHSGETVGYAGSWHCQQATTLGVVAVGYGDGYPRHAAMGTPVLVNGQRVPLIGRVSMDMITVDLAEQPNAKPGDPVTLWGNDLPVEEIAEHCNTIPYTLVCGITQRVKQIDSAWLV